MLLLYVLLTSIRGDDGGDKGSVARHRSALPVGASVRFTVTVHLCRAPRRDVLLEEQLKAENLEELDEAPEESPKFTYLADLPRGR